MSERERLMELARTISARGRNVPFPGRKDTAIAEAFLDALWRPAQLDVSAEIAKRNDMLERVAQAVLADEQAMYDGIGPDGEGHPGSEFLRGYRAAVLRSAAVVREVSS